MILIGLGANLESKDGLTPAGSLQRAAGKLQDHENIRIISASSLWKSAPVPVSDQPWYYNAVCSVETPLSADELLQAIIAIEDESGRRRSLKRNEARVLDLDILTYNQEIIERPPKLQIPHPRMHERAFVLHPLQEIAPDWKHPDTHKTLQDMIQALDIKQKIERTNTKLL